jgi:uncharacterized RDD family membrane protein YckC
MSTPHALNDEPDHKPNAGMRRRLAAVFYDTILVIAIWIATSIPVVGYITDGEEAVGILYQLFLYIEWLVFYVYFWRFRGQTLGMQIWKIRAVDMNGNELDTRRCILRFILATLTLLPFGFGFWWMLFNKEHITIYDDMSGSRVIYLGNSPYRGET